MAISQGNDMKNISDPSVANWCFSFMFDITDAWDWTAPRGVCVLCFKAITAEFTASKMRKIYTGPTYKLPLSFTVISDVYRSFIPN